MENKLKRVFAFLLSMVMLFDLVPFNAFATDTTEPPEETHEHAELDAGTDDEHTHSLTYVEAKDPTCTEEGNIGYFYCECGKYFYDEEAVAEIPAESVILEASHSWDEGVVTVEATETAEGQKTYTCTCGETKTEVIPMLTHSHDLVAVEEKAASCEEDGNSAYFYCDCGKFFSDAEGLVEIAENSWVINASHSMKHMEAVGASCTVPGTAEYWFCSACGQRYADSEGNTVLDYVSHEKHAFSGYTWDFSQGSAVSTNGDRTLSLVKTGVSGATSVDDLLKDGVLESSKTTTMKFDTSITLSSDEDWTVELVAKGYEGVTMRSFLSTNVQIGSAVYFYITNGDLSLVKKVGYTPDGASAAIASGYTYYKVSDADYAASPMGQGTFDQTKYHTYQLRCVDGVISYWLDGEKIGDLALSEQSGTRNLGNTTKYTAGNGCAFASSIETLTVTHVGCGSSSNSTSQALTADVRYLGIYTGHVYSGDCDAACDNEGCTETRTVSAEHTWDDGEVTKEATATEEGILTYTCTACGDTKTEVIPVSSCEHEMTHVEGLAPGCTTAGNSEYWSCSKCGKYYADEFGAEEIEKDSWILSAAGHGTMTKTAAVAATCTESGNLEYYTCAACGKNYAEEAGVTELNEVVIAAKGHGEYVITNPDASCTTAGGTVKTCPDCGHSYYDAVIPGFSGHVWDFSQGSATSTDGERTFSLVTTHNGGSALTNNGTMTFEDGAMKLSKTALELDEGIRLNAEEDWAFEINMSTTAAKSMNLLASSKGIAGSAIAIHLTAKGSLGLMAQVTVNDVKDYSYFVVSDEDFQANMPADFDRAEYHTYRLECNDGKFSYILDGKKIGDLAVTKAVNGKFSATEGAFADFSDFTLKYMSSGTNSNVLFYGVSGDIRYMGVYPGHTWNNACDESCNNIGCNHTREVTHIPGEAVEENRVESTCTVAGSYDEVVYCSVCEDYEISRTKKTLELADHTPGEAVEENRVESTCVEAGSYDEVIYCSVCEDHEISRTKKTIDKLDHVYGEPTFTWTKDDQCEASYVCSVGKETETTDCVVTSASADATCVTPGTVTYTASIQIGDKTYTDENVVVGAALGHVYGEPVFTWTTVDGETTAEAAFTCDVCAAGTEGKTVTKNAVVSQIGSDAGNCKTESTKTYIAKVTLNDQEYTDEETVKGAFGDHVAGEPVEENRVESTCTVAGSYDEVVYCSVCKDHEISRTNKALELADHTPGEAVEENRVESTCTVAGSYDEVVYCSVCKTYEISRTGKPLELADHTLTKVEAAAATCVAEGNVEHWHCSVCEKNFGDEAATEELASVATAVLVDYVWDFSQGSATSAKGDNTLTVVENDKNGTMTIADGVMNGSAVSLEMSQGIQLTSDKDWVFEITMKAHTDADGAVIAPRTVLAESKQYATGVTFYMNAAGNLSLLKKGTVEGVSGKYWHYRVSDEDFAANMPADFSMTDYHTYQLRCENGVFSYWVDGTKIGELSVTVDANNAATKFDGEYLNYSAITAKYIGNGSSSNIGAYGFSGDVKSLAVYPAHSYDNSCDADCNNEGCTHIRAVYHIWDGGKVTTQPSGTADGVMTYTCTVCGETKTEAIPALTEITMKYDDRLAVADLGQTGEPVITTRNVTSKKVGTTTADDAVVVYVDGKLIAVGVGTAEVAWENGAYLITVEPATISMLMVTGHSLGSGSKGDKDQSIICEEGQVYSTNELAYSFKLCTGSSTDQTVEGIDVTGMGLGYGSEKRPTKIDLLNESGAGVQGMDSGLGYGWAKITGEKVWILNSAKGSTSLETWQKGGYNYRHAVELFTTAEEILYNEVQAGHYKVNKLGIVNYTTANGDQTWAPEKYTEAFNSMWNGFRSEMALYDFDGDGTTETVDCIGLLPLWNPCSINNWDDPTPEPLAFYTREDAMYYGKLINYSMSAYEDEGVIMASTAGRNWLTDADVTAYFEANPVEDMYGMLQNGATHTSPTTVQNGVYGDGVHYCQLGYNVQGIETAESMYEYWFGGNDVTALELVQANGVDEVPDAIEIPEGGTYVLVPMTDPSSGKLSYTLTGDAVSYDSCILTGEALGNATLTIQNRSGKTLKTVNITVREKRDEDFTDVVWYEWDFSQGSATNTSGSSTDNTLTLVKSADTAVTSVEDLLKDGTLNADENTTMKLTNSITLDPAKNWVIEMTAKGNGTDAIRSFASTTVALSGYYVYICTDGDLSIVHKGAFTADDGTAVASGYTYYKVSNEDYAASVLASGNFDITQYHSYQLRCENGVFSYWLDGEKVGDLALSEQSAARGDTAKEYTQGNGTPFGLNLMTITHVGCGSTSNASSQGLKATVKELKFYSDSGKLTLNVNLDAIVPIDPMMALPGDVITLPQPDVGDYCAKFIGWSTSQDGTADYNAGDTYTVTGFAPVSMYAVWEAFETSDGEHVFENGICINCGAKKDHKMTAVEAKEATCTSDGNTAYWSCSECGKYFSDAAGENEIAKDSWVIEGGHQLTATEAKEASCAGDGNTAYWTCGRCGKFYSDAEGNVEIQKDSWIIAGGHQLTHVEAKAATCVAAGNVEYWNCSVCKKNFGDEAATQELDSVEIAVLADHVWDFTTNSVAANTGNTLQLMTSKDVYEDFTITNGEWVAEKKIYKLSDPVTLNASEDWTFEIVAKGNGTGAIGTVLSNTRKYGSASGFIYINVGGDLMIGKSGSLVDNDGVTHTLSSSNYTYYKVSDADYHASALADEAFDVTQYHTYELRCEDGVFSFWLDRVKVGDLAMSEQTTARTEGNAEYTNGTGTHFNFTNMKMDHVGNGNSSGSPIFGLTATIQSMGIYPAHSYDNSCDASCNNDGCTHTRVTNHIWNEGEVTKYPTETEEGERKLTCTVCGETKTERIPVSEHIHRMTANEAMEAGCETAGNTAYWYCEGCQKYFSDEDGTTEVEKDSWIVAAKGHSWDAGEVTTEPSASAEGVKTYKCSGCTETKTEVVPATDYAWDFEKDEAISTFGTNTISLVTTLNNGNPATNGTMSVADGVMTVEAASLELAHAVKLTAENKWAFEITMKAHTNANGAVITPKTVLAEDKAYANGNSIYISNAGSMCLLKKATIEGTSDYWYYRVSNEEFAANVPADFDMTQYHTYRLECNGETFSFWLDGEKIGNLTTYVALNKKDAEGKLLTYTGDYLSFSTFTAKFIGNGSSSNIKAFGFTGDVEQMRIITGENAITHEHTMTATEAVEATCTEAGNSAYWYCSGCDKYFSDAKGKTEIEKDSWVIDAKGHTMTATEAVKVSCEADGNSAYWHCSACGKYFSDENGSAEIEKDSWIIAATGHDWDDGVVTTEPTETKEGVKTYTCGNCGGTRTEVLPVLGHTHKLSKVEAKEATCTEAGNAAYWTCSGCSLYFGDAEGSTTIEENSWVIEAKGHSMTAVEAKEATCAENGNTAYWHCSGCEKYFSDAEGKAEIEKDSWVIEAKGHTMTGVEAKEATCTEAGNSAYWSCSVCEKYFSDAEGKTEIEKDSWILQKLAHSLTKVAAKDATCAMAGNLEHWHCSGCDKNFSDENGTQELANVVTAEALADYVWDFSQGTPTSTNGGRTFSLVTTHNGGGELTNNGTMTFEGGVMNLSMTALELNEGIRLNAEKDWAFEITMSTTSAKSMNLLASSKGISGSAIAIHMTAAGSLGLMAQVTVNGVQDYSYFVVSDEDFQANMPADFDRAEYHTYRLECNDGKFSYILDGKKIGDLAVTKAVNGKFSATEGAFADFSDFTLKYMSSGVNKNVLFYGVAGNIKSLGVYPAHVFANNCDTTCDNEGCTHTRVTEHDWDKGEIVRYPTETVPGERKFTCSCCGETKTEEISVNEHFHNMTRVEAAEATCVTMGNVEHWHCSGCNKNFADEEGEEELESVVSAALTDVIWNFSTGTAVSGNGNTLTLVKSANADVTAVEDILKDGVLAATSNTTMQMSQSVTLKSSEDWVVELVAKAENGDSIRSFMSTSKTLAGVYFFIGADGDLSIVHKGAFTADDGTAVSSGYTYYKVSNEDYSMSVLGSGEFDTNEYHTYQLRCEDGVFSYWLDNEKIGNLALSEQTASRGTTAKEYTSGNGTPFDFSELVMTHIGCGATSNAASQGLKGTVKSLSIYPGHSYDNSCDATCNNTGCTFVRDINHTWDYGEITKAPTETTEGERTYTCSVCGATKTEVIPELGKIVMEYDDRLRITDLGQKGAPDSIVSDVVSKKVGTDTPDDAVLAYVDGKLIAVGVGTAAVTWGTGSQAVTYNITVEPAVISMLMVTGHSLGSGSQGTASKTIICEDGVVYCTNERAYTWKITTGSTSTETVEGIDVTGMGLGYGSELRPKNINALNESGDGVNGVDSAIAYRWAQLTGEKVWILNSAKGSTNLSTWQQGGFNYRHAVELFTTAEEIMYNEVQAGHYKLNKMGIVNFTTANGDQTWPADQYRTTFNSMWDGFQEEMRVYDFDGDGVDDTVDCISLLPLWNVCSMNKWDNMIAEPLAFFNSKGTKYYGKLINYAMSAFEDNGVILGSSIMRQWTTDADVAAYFKANPIENLYGKLQDGTTHTSPSTLRNGVYGDGVHYGQLGYNVQGIDIAQNMYDYWYGNNALTSLRLLQGDGVTEVPENVVIRVGEEYVIAPDAVPACAKLTYSMVGNVASYSDCIVTGVSVGTAALTIMDENGTELQTVNITVLPGLEEDAEEVVWYSWDFSKGSATNTSGSSTDNTLSLVASGDETVTTVENILMDGTLAATDSVTMALSKPVTLVSSKNWSVELVAKGNEAGIMSFLSTHAQRETAAYVFINELGDLCIVKRGSFRADDGATISAGYTYYKVSDADYESSVLGNGSFEITEYHTYQLRCTNGVFSYWLDGEKIGDLALSEQSAYRDDSAREYTKNNGTPFDFSELVITHVGCGNSDNLSSQGVRATIKQLNIYTNSGRVNLEVGLDALAPLAPMFAFPGESIVLPRPNNGEYCAKFLGWAENQDGTGTRYQVGDSYTVASFEPSSLYGVWQAFETSDGVHTFVDGVCTSCGVADADYNSWDIWDFDDDTTVSDDGVTAISRITTNYAGSAVTNNGTLAVSSGVMHVNNAALEMSESIKLTSDKDWAVDFTLKALVDSNGEVIVPKTLLAESKLFSEGTSFYLTATGDMLLAQKGTIGSTNTYWYFKVSNEDFANNMPAKYDITKYHTYRVMSTGGVLSYWVDGVKVGDFALTSNSMSRGGTVHNGQKLDYSDLDVRYIGNGNTGNIKAFGFTGDVDRLAVYTESGRITFQTQHSQAAEIAGMHIYPGETIILPKPDTGEFCVKFNGWTMNQDGSGTVYPAESTYKVNGVETLTLYGNWGSESNTSHSYGNKGVITPPTCAAEGYTTYTCTFCGHEKITNPVEKSAHNFTAEVASKEYQCADATYDTAATYYRSCIVCGLSSSGTGGESTFVSGTPGDGYYSVVSKKDWDTAPGITESEIILNNSTGERRQAVHVMQVDISDPYASILPSYMGMNPTPGNFKLGTMSQQANWVEKNMGLNVVGAMNTCLSWYTGDYYEQNPDRKNEPLGILVINGELYAENTSAKTCLVVNYDEKDGVERPANIPKVELRYTKDGVTGWEEQVISCNFDFVVKDGVNTSKVSHVNQSSKSVLGVKADGTIVIMQNDGEQAPYSNGMSIYEIGETMLSLGCVDAVRCDGGGTSTYLSQRPGEELKVTCSPADGAERPTTSGILVISSAPATGEFMRATISSDDTYYAPGCTVAFEAVGTDLVGTKVDIPEDAVWQVKEDGMGTINDGVFVSNGTPGKVTVQIVYNDRVVGEHSIEIVIPETFQFRQPVITVPYGKTVELGFTATINGGLNTVTLNPDDIVFTTDNDALGSFVGTGFAAVEEKDAPENQTSNITATLKSTGMVAKAKLNLGRASVIIDDFEDGISDWHMYHITSRESIDFEFVEANRSNGYVYNGDGAMGMVMHNETQMQQAGYYAQIAVARKEGVELESATSLGAWVYVPDDFYNLWIRFSFYTKDESGAYTKRNITNAVEGGEVYTTIEESGWHYFSCDVSEFDSVYLGNHFIEILSQHCSANALYQTVGSPHGMSAIYVDDVTVDYSEAADDREAPIFSSVTLVAGGTETALMKREMPTTGNSVVSFKAEVSENTAKTNATGLDGKSAKAYVDGVPVQCDYADGTISVSNLALPDGAHRVKFEISDMAGNTAVAIRVVNVASGVAASTIEVVPAEPTLDRLYGGSVYWMNLDATRIETVQKVTLDIDLNAVNHWELDHMELADGFEATYTVDNKTNTAYITITRTGDVSLSGKQTLASLPIRVIYFDTDIALNGYTAQTFWQEYNFWPQDVAVDVDRGVIEYVDGYEANVRNTFSSIEYSIDTEMYTSGQHMDPEYKAQRGTAHVHTAEALTDTEATCTEDGYVNRTYCQICESVVEWGTKQVAAGHKYEDQGGVMICSVCGEKLNGLFQGKTYIDGIVADGWIDDTYYYVDGVMVTGQYLMDGVLYNFDENGVYDPDYLYTGFYETEDGKLMYFAANKYVTGYQYILGEPYYFDGNGVAYDGEYVLCGETCLFRKGQFVSCSTADLIDAGMCGDKAEYVIYADGTMVLGGSGATFSFPNHGNRPFIKNISKIKKLVVGADITRIGTYFMSYTGVQSVEFAADSKLKELASASFYENISLTEVKMPASVDYISDMAFGNCSKLSKVTFEANEFRLLYDSAFKNDKNLTLYVLKDSEALAYAIKNNIPYVIYDPEVKNGIVQENGGLYYYVDGKLDYAGLIQIDGAYYYVRSSGQLVTNHMYWITKTNGLLPEGEYAFGVDGRMLTDDENSGVFTDGILKTDEGMFYYRNGKLYYAGLMEYEGDYYYVRSTGQLAVNRTYWITKTNGLMPEGDYSFDTNGRMIMEGDGIVDVDGTLYYLHNGQPSYVGLISMGDDYYYVRSNGQVVVNRSYWITKTNGILPAGEYSFGANGKMLIERKITIENVDGVLCCYREGAPFYAGLFELNGDYYYARSNTQLVVNSEYWITKTNGILPAGKYTFGADGKLLKG